MPGPLHNDDQKRLIMLMQIKDCIILGCTNTQIICIVGGFILPKNFVLSKYHCKEAHKVGQCYSKLSTETRKIYVN